ncbi:hypothetical protein LX36DRAFT_34642 [Colletotrichum falcatum]|nr:hypothetical protein LX36DRAFT_34642 [Colletotrichum falcatum]
MLQRLSKSEKNRNAIGNLQSRRRKKPSSCTTHLLIHGNQRPGLTIPNPGHKAASCIRTLHFALKDAARNRKTRRPGRSEAWEAAGTAPVLYPNRTSHGICWHVDRQVERLARHAEDPGVYSREQGSQGVSCHERAIQQVHPRLLLNLLGVKMGRNLQVSMQTQPSVLGCFDRSSSTGCLSTHLQSKHSEMRQDQGVHNKNRQL